MLFNAIASNESRITPPFRLLYDVYRVHNAICRVAFARQCLLCVARHVSSDLWMWVLLLGLRCRHTLCALFSCRLALDQLLRVMFVICGFCCGCRQELTETALALEEKRRELRRCFEDMEVQRLAFESRAAAAAAQAEAAAAEARDAKILQQESLQAKEAVHKLHLQAKDVRMICTRRLTFNPTCRAIGRPHCIK